MMTEHTALSCRVVVVKSGRIHSTSVLSTTYRGREEFIRFTIRCAQTDVVGSVTHTIVNLLTHLAREHSKVPVRVRHIQRFLAVMRYKVLSQLLCMCVHAKIPMPELLSVTGVINEFRRQLTGS